MLKKYWKIKILALSICFLPAFVLAHSGRTNSSGCHNNTKTGGYHCHNGGTTNYNQPTNNTYSQPTNSNPPQQPVQYTQKMNNIPECPADSLYNEITEQCDCVYGYVAAVDNSCIPAGEYCNQKYGDNAYYNVIDKGCACARDYTWNSDTESCSPLDEYCPNTYGEYAEESILRDRCSCIIDTIYDQNNKICITKNTYCKNKWGEESKYIRLMRDCDCDNLETPNHKELCGEVFPFSSNPPKSNLDKIIEKNLPTVTYSIKKNEPIGQITEDALPKKAVPLNNQQQQKETTPTKNLTESTDSNDVGWIWAIAAIGIGYVVFKKKKS